MRWILFIIFTATAGQAAPLDGYTKSCHVSDDEWERIKPFLLPEELPVKTALDAIFKQRRAVLSTRAMKKAGFIDPVPQETTRVIVTSHPKLKGYIIKTYLDSQRARKNCVESTFWLMRIEGARSIAQLIQSKSWGHHFKVPKKWIYPLPEEPSPPKVFQRINFILVEEDMNLLPHKKNLACWGSEKVTPSLLTDIFTILETIGLHDCAKPDNIPFSVDGRIAFIDTQTHNQWPIDHKKLLDALTPEMRCFWKDLYKGNGASRKKSG